MVFSSHIFLFYFLPAFLLVYFLVRPAYRNYVALIFSLFFYAWGAPEFVYILIGSAFVDHVIAGQMHRQHNNKVLLGIGVALNVGLLVYYKYANFFVDNLNLLLYNAGQGNVDWVYVALPIGISFTTFQKISYLTDVYRKTTPPIRHFPDYLLFVTLFPQLIAGPIIRFKELAGQIGYRNHHYTVDNIFAGIFRFVIGLSKKVLIANIIGEQVDILFKEPVEALSSFQVWLGILGYTLQIYYDFSGYSDMAIGIGRIIGFRFPENFNFPYISRSITEFWRRWHITLGSWMKDYLYIPLGGNRTNNIRMYINLWVVFFISGLWHGASWNFVIWGLYHGLFLIADKLFLVTALRKTGRFINTLVVFFIVVMGWVLFRFDSMGEAIQVYQQLFSFSNAQTVIDLPVRFYALLVIGLLFAFSGYDHIRPYLDYFSGEAGSRGKVIIQGLVGVFLLFLCIGELSTSGFNPFIYFRF